MKIDLPPKRGLFLLRRTPARFRRQPRRQGRQLRRAARANRRRAVRESSSRSSFVTGARAPLVAFGRSRSNVDLLFLGAGGACGLAAAAGRLTRPVGSRRPRADRSRRTLGLRFRGPGRCGRGTRGRIELVRASESGRQRRSLLHLRRDRLRRGPRRGARGQSGKVCGRAGRSAFAGAGRSASPPCPSPRRKPERRAATRLGSGTAGAAGRGRPAGRGGIAAFVRGTRGGQIGVLRTEGFEALRRRRCGAAGAASAGRAATSEARLRRGQRARRLPSPSPTIVIFSFCFRLRAVAAVAAPQPVASACRLAGPRTYARISGNASSAPAAERGARRPDTARGTTRTRSAAFPPRGYHTRDHRGRSRGAVAVVRLRRAPRRSSELRSSAASARRRARVDLRPRGRRSRTSGARSRRRSCSRAPSRSTTRSTRRQRSAARTTRTSTAAGATPPSRRSKRRSPRSRTRRGAARPRAAWPPSPARS